MPDSLSDLTPRLAVLLRRLGEMTVECVVCDGKGGHGAHPWQECDGTMPDPRYRALLEALGGRCEKNWRGFGLSVPIEGWDEATRQRSVRDQAEHDRGGCECQGTGIAPRREFAAFRAAGVDGALSGVIDEAWPDGAGILPYLMDQTAVQVDRDAAALAALEAALEVQDRDEGGTEDTRRGQ